MESPLSLCPTSLTSLSPVLASPVEEPCLHGALCPHVGEGEGQGRDVRRAI